MFPHPGGHFHLAHRKYIKRSCPKKDNQHGYNNQSKGNINRVAYVTKKMQVT